MDNGTRGGRRKPERAKCEDEMQKLGEGLGKLILGENDTDLFMGLFFF